MNFAPLVPGFSRPTVQGMSVGYGIIVRMGRKVSDGVKRAYKFRFYPADGQVSSLNRFFGAKRFVWNKALAARTEAYERDGTRLTGNDLMLELTKWKKEPETAWLNDISSVVLQQGLNDLEAAFTNFFASCTGERNGPRMRYPRFKTRNSRKSVRFPKTGFTYVDGEIRLGRMREEPLDIRWSQELPEGVAPSSVTVSQDAAGRWFVSILCEEIIAPLPKTSAMVGIDLGLKTFAVLSDGECVEHPKLLAKKAKRLARYQRVASRRKGAKKGETKSANYVKAKIRVAKQHTLVADARRDFHHKTSTDLVRRYDVIVMEGLATSNMLKNRRLAKAISDSGWATFKTHIEYKTVWYGKRIVVIDRWHPSSRLCSTPGCDWKNSKLKLSERSWTCLECGTLHDRDLNAAKNILAAGLAVIQRELDKACGEDVRPKQSPRVTARKGRLTSVKQETTPNVHAHARTSAA